MRDTKVTSPQSAIFSCETTLGEPNGTIKWFKNGKELTASKKYSMTYTGGIASLTISQTEASDIGTYICQVQNKLGHADTEATLSVLG